MSNQDVAETFEIVWHGASVGADGEKGQLLPGYSMTTPGDVRASRIVKAEASAVLLGRPVRKPRSFADDAEMRRRRARGVSLRILAADYHCSLATVCQITKWGQQ